MTTPTIDVGTIGNAVELVFTAGNKDHRYILQPKGTTEDWLSTSARFPKHQFKQTVEHYIDDTEGAWFACYNVDCFDPPFAIVRARSFEQAYEVFCDEFSDWLKVDEADAADYPEDERDYNGSGVHIDASAVQLTPLTLLSVRLACDEDA